jgi:hypothetical protein
VRPFTNTNLANILVIKVKDWTSPGFYLFLPALRGPFDEHAEEDPSATQNLRNFDCAGGRHEKTQKTAKKAGFFELQSLAR